MVSAIAALLVAGILYSVVIEPQWIRHSHYDVAIPNLPKSFEGYTILHLSDFHGRVGAFSFLHKYRIQTDLVVITGDLFAWKTLPRSRIVRALNSLVASDGVHYVSGNHDYRHGQLDVEPWEVGERLLDNRVVTLNRGQDTIWLAGIPDLVKGCPRLDEIVTQIPEGAPAILLSHRPDAVLLPDARRFDLVLSGHTHGGQVTLWGHWVPVRHTRVGSRYVAGLWRNSTRTVLITSQGLGESELPIRFGTRPEIVEIRLHGSRTAH